MALNSGKFYIILILIKYIFFYLLFWLSFPADGFTASSHSSLTGKSTWESEDFKKFAVQLVWNCSSEKLPLISAEHAYSYCPYITRSLVYLSREHKLFVWIFFGKLNIGFTVICRACDDTGALWDFFFALNHLFFGWVSCRSQSQPNRYFYCNPFLINLKFHSQTFPP